MTKSNHKHIYTIELIAHATVRAHMCAWPVLIIGSNIALIQLNDSIIIHFSILWMDDCDF